MSTLPDPNLRVLVVDDNTDAADLLVLLLSSMNIAARAAYGGHEAIAVAEEMAPNVVFLDLDMPAMSGYEVAQALRKRATLATTTIIALTGRGDPATRHKVMSSGFNDHLTKPAGIEQICEVLTSAFA